MNYRSRAFAILLAHVANVGSRTGHFDPDAPNTVPMLHRRGTVFDAPLADIPLRGRITDWRFNEARIVAVAWPTPEVDSWIRAAHSNALAGDVMASGWLERDHQLRVANVWEPTIFIRKCRIDAMRSLSDLDQSADPLGLYQRYRMTNVDA